MNKSYILRSLNRTALLLLLLPVPATATAAIILRIKSLSSFHLLGANYSHRLSLTFFSILHLYIYSLLKLPKLYDWLF